MIDEDFFDLREAERLAEEWSAALRRIEARQAIAAQAIDHRWAGVVAASREAARHMMDDALDSVLGAHADAVALAIAVRNWDE